MTNRRNTIQKELVRVAVANLHGHVSAEDVFEYIRRDHPNIGKGTVYRNLNLLAEENTIRKIEIPNAADCFDFMLTEHYHIRCIECGAVEDVDMEAIHLNSLIRDSRGFKFLGYDILFRGICEKCRQKNG